MLAAWFWGPGRGWVLFLALDPRTLGPSQVVRRSGAEGHSGCAHSLQTSGSLQGGIARYMTGYSGGSMWIMAGKQHSLSVLCHSLLKIVS